MRAICQACGKTWTEDKLNPIERLHERVGVGEPMPAGQCGDTECGALCHADVSIPTGQPGKRYETDEIQCVLRGARAVQECVQIRAMQSGPVRPVGVEAQAMAALEDVLVWARFGQLDPMALIKALGERFATPQSPPMPVKDEPRRWRSDLPVQNPSGDGLRYLTGCYFPRTDLNMNDMGGRGTGRPTNVVWLDGQ